MSDLTRVFADIGCLAQRVWHDERVARFTERRLAEFARGVSLLATTFGALALMALASVVLLAVVESVKANPLLSSVGCITVFVAWALGALVERTRRGKQ